MKKYLFLSVAVIIFFAPATAFAYIDPGAGSMMAQVLMGVVIGGFFWFRERIAQFLRKIKSLFK